MKYYLLLILSFFIVGNSLAQVVSFNPIKRSIRFKVFENDSVNISLNNDYYLIEDSCAQIIRYGHLKIKNRIYYGKVKDVSKIDPNVIVTEGSYTNDGLKNGEFITRYLNGNLHAKGIFKNNKYDGKWDIYYEDGKPELSFEANSNDIKITNAWKPDGTKIVDNGNGLYTADVDEYYWRGKLVNGKPDGTWRFLLKVDVTETPLATEYFKKGKFHNGSFPSGDYSDSSHIVLVSPDLLPFTHAEKFQISQIACDGSGFKKIVNAQYIDGLDSFSERIKELVTPVISKYDLSIMSGYVNISGDVSEKGIIENLHSSNSTDFVQKIMYKLRSLPFLEPATANGMPVKENFFIEFHIQNGSYSFNYRFSTN